VARTSATALLVIHAVSTLAPEKALQTYGVKAPTPTNVFVARREWTFFLAVSLGAYLWLVHDKSVNTAVGYGTFPIIAEVIRSILNDEEKKLGIPDTAQVVVVLTPLLVNAYACLKNLDDANTITKVCGAYNVVKGFWYFLDTENSGKAWGLSEGEDDPFVLGSAKWMGISLIVYGMTLVGMAHGVVGTKLMGYAWIPVVLNMVRETFITKAVEKHGLNRSLYYAWMVLGLVVIGTLAIE
jgi:hypothetical protein